MKNAPVYFVLAQVRHNPILTLPSFSAAIQEQMRKSGYPGFATGMNFFLPFPNQPEASFPPDQMPPQSIPRYVFSNAAGDKVFIVDFNAVTFYTTSYTDFEEFSTEFAKGIGIVHEIITLSFSERLGLRYLDAVVPPSGELGLSEYLAAGVLGINQDLPEHTMVARSFSETIFETPDCVVAARTVIQAGRLGFPPDLQLGNVNFAERFQNINSVHAIIDTDAGIEKRREFSIDLLMHELVVLHDAGRLAFELTVTDKAMADWKG